MAVTAQTIQETLTEFASVSSTRIDIHLSFAQLQMSTDAWANKYDMGLIYLTGHLLKLEKDATTGGAASGPISAEAVGQVSASYAISDTFKDSEFGSTWYGRRFLELRKMVFACRCM